MRSTESCWRWHRDAAQMARAQGEAADVWACLWEEEVAAAAAAAAVVEVVEEAEVEAVAVLAERLISEPWLQGSGCKPGARETPRC
jgi:hypothetical protein